MSAVLVYTDFDKNSVIVLGMHLTILRCTAKSDSTAKAEFLFSCFYLELGKRRRYAKEQHTALQKRSLLQLCQLKSSLTHLVSKTSQNRAEKESQKNKIKKCLYSRSKAQ